MKASHGALARRRVRSPGPAAPTITSVSPGVGPVGTALTITGTNLTSASVVFASFVPATITSNTATQIVVPVPAGAITGLVTVATAGGSASFSFTVTVAGTYGSTYRYNRAGDANTLITLPRRYNALGEELGPILYDSSTGRYGRIFEVDHATAANVGPVIGTPGNDDATIDANTAALQAAYNARSTTGGRIRVHYQAVFRPIDHPNQPTRQNAREWVVIEAVNPDLGTDQFPRAANERHQLADDAHCAILRIRDQDNPGGGSNLWAGFSVSGGASFIRWVGWRVQLSGAINPARAQILGGWATVTNRDSFIINSASQWLVVDRCHADGRSTPNGWKRQAWMNGDFICYRGSRFTECGQPGDTDCMNILFTAGKACLVDNCWTSCEQASYNFMSGGTPATAGRIPTDVQIRDSYFEDSIQRVGAGSSVAKCLIEFKYCDRWHVENVDCKVNRPMQFSACIVSKLAANGSDTAIIKNQNGLVRLARSVGAPIVALYGKDVDAVTAPENPRRFVVEQVLTPPDPNPSALRTANGIGSRELLRIDLDAEVVAHHLTMVGPYTVNGFPKGFHASGGTTSTTRTDWGFEASLILMPFEAGDGNGAESYFQNNDAFALFGQIGAQAQWNGITKTRSDWRRNGITWYSPRAKATTVINWGTAESDIVVDTLEQALMNADGSLQAGSPFKGVDTDGGDLGADVPWMLSHLTRATTGL